MTDSGNLSQNDPGIAPPNGESATLASSAPTFSASDPHAYPPEFLASEIPPSPEQLAQRARISKIPPDLRVPWGWADLGVFLLVFICSMALFQIVALLAAAAIQHVDASTLLKT